MNGKEKAIKVLLSLIEAKRIWKDNDDEYSVGYCMGIDRAIGYLKIVFDIDERILWIKNS